MFGLTDLIMLALMTPATVYGFGEKNCGNPGKPKPCVYGAITASGEIFDPRRVTGAITVPAKMRFKPFTVLVRSYKNECIPLRINDKSNHRWIGKRGFDLTPAAVKAITGRVHKKWSGRLEFCVETFDLFR